MYWQELILVAAEHCGCTLQLAEVIRLAREMARYMCSIPSWVVLRLRGAIGTEGVPEADGLVV